MLFILASGVLFAIMSAFTRMAIDNGMSSMQVVCTAGVVRWFGLAISVARAKQSPFAPRSARLLLVLRSLCGMTAYSLATYSFGVMPIGDATTIFLTSPVWAALLGFVVLREPLRLTDALALLLALVGVVLVARPEALFGSSRDGSAASGAQHARGGLPGAYAALLGAIFAGSVAVLVRLLKKHGNPHPAVIAHAVCAARASNARLAAPDPPTAPDQPAAPDQCSQNRDAVALTCCSSGRRGQYAFVTVAAAPLGLLLPGQSPHIHGLRHPLATWALCAGVGCLAIPNQVRPGYDPPTELGILPASPPLL
jgi:drug/metabolite transporter (DMT)-like permease